MSEQLSHTARWLTTTTGEPSDGQSPTTYSITAQKPAVLRPRFLVVVRRADDEFISVAWVGNDEKAALDTYWALMTPGQMPELYERRPVVMV